MGVTTTVVVVSDRTGTLVEGSGRLVLVVVEAWIDVVVDGSGWVVCTDVVGSWTGGSVCRVVGGNTVVVGADVSGNR